MADEEGEFMITSEEAKRFKSAFKKREFRDLFVQYADEISDPENKKLYEKELAELEKQRGVDLKFVNPEPGFVLKAFILPDKKKKAFINFCHCDVIEMAGPSGRPSQAGFRGQHWNVPFSLSPPRDDFDKAKNKCVVFDAVFHPETYRLSLKDPRIKKLLIDTALDGIESHLHTVLDRTSLKELRMTCKGKPDSTVIRRKDPNKTEDETPPTYGLDFPYPPLKKDLKDKTKSSMKRTKPTAKKLPDTDSATPTTDSTTMETRPRPLDTKPRPQEPTYRVVHRGEFSLQDFTLGRVSSRVRRPKELVISVELPGLESASQVELDIFEKQLVLNSTSPPYALDLALSYPIDEEQGSATFDKHSRTLTIVLPVLAVAVRDEPSIVAPPLVSEIDDGLTNQEPESVSHDSEDGSHDLPSEAVVKDSAFDDSTNQEPEPVSHDSKGGSHDSKDGSHDLPSEAVVEDSALGGSTNQEAEVESDHVTNTWLTNEMWSCPPFSYRQDDDHVIFLLYTSQVKEKTIVTHFDTHECHVTFTKGSRSFSLYLSFPPPSLALEPAGCKVDVSHSNVVVVLKKGELNRGSWAQFRVGVNAQQTVEKCFLTVENVENTLAEISPSTDQWAGAGWSERSEFTAEQRQEDNNGCQEDQLHVTIEEPSASDDVIAPSMTNDDIIAPSMINDDVIAPSVTNDDVIAPSMTNDDVITPSRTNDDIISCSSQENTALNKIGSSEASIPLVTSPADTQTGQTSTETGQTGTETGQSSLVKDGTAASASPTLPLVISEGGQTLTLGNQLIYSLDLD